MALGIAAGTVARRTLPAIAIVLGGFIGLRLVISDFLRPHYMTAVTHYYSLTSSFAPPSTAWVLAQGAISRTGVVVPQGWGSPEKHRLSSRLCQILLPGPSGLEKGGSR